MSEEAIRSISEHFASLEDQRRGAGKRHKLIDIIVIAICGVICGADSWVEIEQFGKAKESWLKQYLGLPHGIPSHDTFGRVFALLEAAAFEGCFLSWVQAVFRITSGQVVALDGKSVRRSHDSGCGQSALHLVSAWATVNHLVLGQVRVAEDSNEITAIPALLELLALSGCIVTLDAIGCQREIAETILAQDADWLLTVKENQPNLLDDVQFFFELAHQNDFRKVEHTYHRCVNAGHGRVEIRQCWAIGGEENLAFLREYRHWAGLKSIAMVINERRLNDESTTETRYYISSLDSNAELILKTARSHWQIENSLHWVLDVALREDDSRVRKGSGAQNFALLRKIALNLLRQETTARCGIKAKRLKAAWDEQYLLKVLSPP